MALIDPSNVKMTTTWGIHQYDHDVRNHGLNVGVPRNLKVEHIPTGTIIWLGPEVARNQIKARKIALEALEFILTHPDAEKLP